MQAEEPVHVVTCFLRRGSRVLILKRSHAVRTNKGLWAGVSGYIEPGETPRETAYKELAEEVAARPEQVRLVREGPPLTFLDRTNETTWVVHPFLFDDLGVEIETDWEHTEHAWVEPGELASRHTVTGLRRTLEAALGLGGDQE